MKCYYHNDKDAVGICKNCNKGICIECITEVENGIACSTHCANEVMSINNLINKSKRVSEQISKTHNAANKMHIKNGVLYLIFGLLFLLYGFLSESNIKFILYPISGVFIIGAILSFSNIRKLKE